MECVLYVYVFTHLLSVHPSTYFFVYHLVLIPTTHHSPSAMPLNIHHHKSSTGQSDIESSQYTTTNALFQASQTLGSVGAPTSLSRHAGLTSAGTDGLLLSPGDTTGVNGPDAMNSGHDMSSVSAPITPASREGPQFESPQRAPTFGRQPEELHMSSSANAMEAHHYQSAPHYNAGEGLSIHLQPSTSQYNSSSAGTNVPSALQPGLLNRPATFSSNTAPGSVPMLPQLSTQMQRTPQSNRSVTLNHAHNYSRSSPAGMDQPKYKPFTNTPEASKFSSPNPSYVSQMSQGASYSPLGLADIRPRADTGLSDGPMSPTAFSEVDAAHYPTNSNYLTPWPIYAVDWCKWPPKQNGLQTGKIALGSYLEDNHNYVGDPWSCSLDGTDPWHRFKSWMLKEHRQILMTLMAREDWTSSRPQKPHILTR
jgi:DDB1- and CUL4-associated factor 7